MKTVEMYKVQNSRIAEMNNETELREFATKLGYSNPEIITVSIQMIEDGDNVVFDKHIGGIEDEDGITTGGQWIEMTGTYHAYNNVTGEVSDEFGRICSMDAQINHNTYPARNVKVI